MNSGILSDIPFVIPFEKITILDNLSDGVMGMSLALLVLCVVIGLVIEVLLPSVDNQMIGRAAICLMSLIFVNLFIDSSVEKNLEIVKQTWSKISNSKLDDKRYIKDGVVRHNFIWNDPEYKKELFSSDELGRGTSIFDPLYMAINRFFNVGSLAITALFSFVGIGVNKFIYTFAVYYTKLFVFVPICLGVIGGLQYISRSAIITVLFLYIFPWLYFLSSLIIKSLFFYNLSAFAELNGTEKSIGMSLSLILSGIAFGFVPLITILILNGKSAVSGLAVLGASFASKTMSMPFNVAGNVATDLGMRGFKSVTGNPFSGANLALEAMRFGGRGFSLGFNGLDYSAKKGLELLSKGISSTPKHLDNMKKGAISTAMTSYVVKSEDYDKGAESFVNSRKPQGQTISLGSQHSPTFNTNPVSDLSNGKPFVFKRSNGEAIAPSPVFRLSKGVNVSRDNLFSINESHISSPQARTDVDLRYFHSRNVGSQNGWGGREYNYDYINNFHIEPYTPNHNSGMRFNPNVRSYEFKVNNLNFKG